MDSIALKLKTETHRVYNGDWKTKVYPFWSDIDYLRPYLSETTFSCKSTCLAISDGDFKTIGDWLPIWKNMFEDIKSIGFTNKISIIKEVRRLTGLGLKDAKDITELWLDDHPDY